VGFGILHCVEGLRRADQRVLDAIDEGELVDHLAALVRVPSVTGSAAEADALRLLAGWYAEAGLEVDLWRDHLQGLRAAEGFPGSEAPREESWGLVGTTPGTGEPALVLSGHVDVVPPGDPATWAGGDPFSARVEGGRMHGRGTCDMKAGVVASLAVARALRRSGVPLGGRLALHAVVGEEDGGIGAFATLRRGHRGAACVITEPTAGRCVTANAGALTFRLEVAGRAAHGSTRTEGVSAIEAFLPLHEALRDLESDRNVDPPAAFGDDALPYGISVGTVQAGEWASTVPDRLVAEGRLGVRLDEEPDAARAALVEALAAAAQADPWLRDHPPVVTWPGGQFASGRLPQGHPLAEEVAAAAEVAGTPPPPTAAAPYGSDLRLYAAAGVPTLQYGPGDVRLAHSSQESVALDEVVEVTRTLAVLAARRLDAG
jgi:acetylornithine deacetylase